MWLKFWSPLDAASCTLPEDLGLLDRLLRPDAGHQIVGRAALRQQVHRHHGELERRAALEEQHAVVVRNAGQLAAGLLRLVGDLVEHLARGGCAPCTPIPLPAMFQMSCCACFSTGSGSVAGPALKL